MVIILVEKISPRIEYTFKQVFDLFLKVPYTISQDFENVVYAQNFILNYSHNSAVKSHLHILPVELLFEQTINQFTPEHFVKDREVKLFLNGSSQYGFDVFAAIFWMITRYEEYTAEQFDHHKRFAAKSSFAYKHGFLEIPVVDIWLNQLAAILEKEYPGFVPKQKFSITNTIDVDNAFAFKGKGFARYWGAYFRDLINGNFAVNKKRSLVLSGKEKDPFDTYEYIKSQTESTNIRTIFFHLVGKKAKHDRNIDIQSKTYRQLLVELSQWSEQGLHPSYQSNSDQFLVKEEKSWLESSLGKKIIYSRQHFLVLSFPSTYNNLIDSGIQHDFTMGFADEVGFRAGTSNTFAFFDLVSNTEKPLFITPFCVMDGTLHDYLKLDALQAAKKVKQLAQMLKELELPYVSLWHNETLSESNGWEGWRSVYESQFI